jgi:hypothetical protein
MRSIRRHASHERLLRQLRLAQHDANESAAGGAWEEEAGADGAPAAAAQRAVSVDLEISAPLTKPLPLLNLCSAEVAAVEEVVLSEIILAKFRSRDQLSSRDQRTAVEEINEPVTKPLLYLNLCSNCD